MSKQDNVNSPKHYTLGNFETIDVIMDITRHVSGPEGYLLGNIIKYLSRYHTKNGLEDLEKARWYVNKLIEIQPSDSETSTLPKGKFNLPSPTLATLEDWEQREAKVSISVDSKDGVITEEIYNGNGQEVHIDDFHQEPGNLKGAGLNEGFK